MSGYHWRGHTPRCQAARRWADAQWEHDQRVTAQQGRRKAAPEPPSPGAGAARTWQTQAIADAISRPVTMTAEEATP